MCVYIYIYIILFLLSLQVTVLTVSVLDEKVSQIVFAPKWMRLAPHNSIRVALNH